MTFIVRVVATKNTYFDCDCYVKAYYEVKNVFQSLF